MKLKIKSLFPAAVLLHLLHSVSFCQEIPNQKYGESDGCFVISGTSTWINTDGSLGKTTRFSWKYYHSLECQKDLEKYENKEWIRYALSKSCSKCLNQKPNFDSGPRGSSIRLSSDTNHTDVNNHQRRVKDIVIPIEQNYTKDDIALLAEMQQKNLQTQAEIEQLAEDYNNAHAGDFAGGRPSSLENFDENQDDSMMGELFEALDVKEESDGVEVFYGQNGDKTTFTDFDGDGYSDYKVVNHADGSITREDLTEGRDGTSLDHDEAGYNYLDESDSFEPKSSGNTATESSDFDKGSNNATFDDLDVSSRAENPLNGMPTNSEIDRSESSAYYSDKQTSMGVFQQSEIFAGVTQTYSNEVSDDLENLLADENWFVKGIRRFRLGYNLFMSVNAGSTTDERSRGYTSASSIVAPWQTPSFLLPVFHNANKNSLDVMGDQFGLLMDGRKLRTLDEVFRDMLFRR